MDATALSKAAPCKPESHLREELCSHHDWSISPHRTSFPNRAGESKVRAASAKLDPWAAEREALSGSDPRSI